MYINISSTTEGMFKMAIQGFLSWKGFINFDTIFNWFGMHNFHHYTITLYGTVSAKTAPRLKFYKNASRLNRYNLKESCHYWFLQIVDFYLFRYGDTAMQSKVHVSRSNRAFLSPWTASILPSGTEKGAIRAGNVDFTLHCCISITDKVKINDLQKSIVTGLL